MSLESRNWLNPHARPAREGVEHMDAARASFLRKTYIHLGLAIVLFVIIESLLLQSSFIGSLVQTMAGGRFSWLLVLRPTGSHHCRHQTFAAFLFATWIGVDDVDRDASVPAIVPLH